MASNAKKHRSRAKFRRVHLTIEKLEDRTLFSVSPPAPPTLEPMLAPLPVEHADLPIEHHAELPIEHHADLPIEHHADMPIEQHADMPIEHMEAPLLLTSPGTPDLNGGEATFEATASPNLVAAWGFDATSGNTAADSSGNSLNGTVSGATWSTSGKYGGALSFDGVNDWVTVNDNNLLDLTTGMTLEAWVRPSTINNWETVIMKERPGGLAYDLYGGSPSGPPAGYITRTGTSTNIGANGTGALPLNTWSHLAATYDGATIRLYVNGGLVSSQAAAGSIMTSSNPLRIGGNAVWGTEYFAGLIDEVRIYDRALTQTEIQVDMSTPVGNPAPPPLTNQWTPLVFAGADSTVDLGQAALLSGEAISNTSQGLTITWDLVSGPGTATFGDPNSANTTVTFSAGGVYELVLTVSNDFAAAIDRVVVTAVSNNEDEVLTTNNPLTVAEGATGAITSTLLTTTDVDNTPSQLTYTVTAGPTRGTLRKSGTATTSFTQADINAGIITYQHNGSETTSDSFSFRVKDGEGAGTNATFNINVTPVNDEQVLSTNSPLSVATGATATIKSSHLRTTDADNEASQLTYTITSGPTQGTLRRSGSATTSFTQADIDAGLITYQHNGSQTTSDIFTFTVNDGQGSSSSGTFNISVTSSTAGPADSFEGGGTTGWDNDMWSATGAPSYAGLATTNEVTPPPGGGTYTLRQWWNGPTPEWLVYSFDSLLQEGDVFQLDYWLMYDPNFNYGGEFVKSIIVRNQSASQELYIDSHVDNGQMGVLLQQTTDTHWLYANRNGGGYSMPNGQWVHFTWEIKVSTQVNGNPRNGYLYGWVNGVKRWEYDNINTIYSGQYRDFNLNSTFKTGPGTPGPNQKRYWDLFSVRPIAPNTSGRPTR